MVFPLKFTHRQLVNVCKYITIIATFGQYVCIVLFCFNTADDVQCLKLHQGVCLSRDDCYGAFGVECCPEEWPAFICINSVHDLDMHSPLVHINWVRQVADLKTFFFQRHLQKCIHLFIICCNLLDDNLTLMVVCRFGTFYTQQPTFSWSLVNSILLDESVHMHFVECCFISSTRFKALSNFTAMLHRTALLISVAGGYGGSPLCAGEFKYVSILIGNQWSDELACTFIAFQFYCPSYTHLIQAYMPEMYLKQFSFLFLLNSHRCQ